MHWVIGDIHGMLRPLRALVERVRKHDPGATLLFVGDYVNRGPDSKGVLDFLISLDNARFGRGNHDDVFDLLLHGRGFVENPSAPNEVAAFRWFIQHGLWETMVSYGVEPWDVDQTFVRASPESVARVMSAVPEAHRAFIRNLEPVMEFETFFVAHAMWAADESDTPPILPRVIAEPRLRYQVLWGRYGRELTRPKPWKRTGFFGHTPVQTYPADLQGVENTPIRGPSIVLLDTACALTPEGRLSAVCAETGETIQVDRLGGAV
ncbi:MAG TPA: metallophosphoesterase [Humisphaera sp.]